LWRCAATTAAPACRDAGGTSLAVQPDLRAQLRARRYPFHYLCGERDAKFRAIARDVAATTHIIHHAGHNAHRENPAAVVSCLAQFLAS
jgi:2-succinyl-6-hydroxy-2,4-cyclohexadiene-1-carboxylate synthase